MYAWSRDEEEGEEASTQLPSRRCDCSVKGAAENVVLASKVAFSNNEVSIKFPVLAGAGDPVHLLAELGRR